MLRGPAELPGVRCLAVVLLLCAVQHAMGILLACASAAGAKKCTKTRDISHTSKDVFYNRGKKLLGLTLCSGLRLFWIHRAPVHCVLLNLKNKNFCSIKFDPPPLPKGHVLFPMRLLGLHTHRHHTLCGNPWRKRRLQVGGGGAGGGCMALGGEWACLEPPCKELPSKQCDCLRNKAV